MCGIVAYVGVPEAGSLVIESLRRLEYRGYDSAGLAVRHYTDGLPRLTRARAVGRLKNLQDVIAHNELPEAYMAIGHTRWATHGAATEANAHPHLDCHGDFAVVHNGMIENQEVLREDLISQGHTFASETDTEVLAHLFEREAAKHPWPHSHTEHHSYLAHLASSVAPLLQGSQVVVVLSRQSSILLAFRTGNAGGLAVGSNASVAMFASDVPAIAPHASDFWFIDSGEIVTAAAGEVLFYSAVGGFRSITKSAQHIVFPKGQTELVGYSTHMLKEIFEQPDALRRGLEQRIQLQPPDILLADMNLSRDAGPELTGRNLRKIVLTGCGTPWNACLVGRQFFEDLAGIPCQVEYAHEYAYRSPLHESNTLFIAVTQSGETADVLLALEVAKSAGASTLTITNVAGSASTRISDATWYLNSGPEFCVAETKTFTSQLLLLLLLAIKFGIVRQKLPPEAAAALIDEVARLPDRATACLGSTASDCAALATTYAGYESFLFLGRGLCYPIAQEGALKLKELSYAHAEGYPAGEMKHGPIALITENYPVVALVPKDSSKEKMLMQMQQIKARGARILAVTNAPDTRISSLTSDILYFPMTSAVLAPILAVIPLQLLAYHIATERGNDVDHPRNLAKSVTVG